jgi:hypothetical protein
LCNCVNGHRCFRTGENAHDGGGLRQFPARREGYFAGCSGERIDKPVAQIALGGAGLGAGFPAFLLQPRLFPIRTEFRNLVFRAQPAYPPLGLLCGEPGIQIDKALKNFLLRQRFRPVVGIVSRDEV